MVSGGTFGVEDVVHGAGYGRAILILLLTPILWSLPTAYMIGELSSALPKEGGFYAWVRRAMGDFWGFQEAWLSLVASVFDMAIYPPLFVLYLSRLFPWFSVNHRGIMVGLAVVIVCAVMNIAGIRVVAMTSIWLFFLLSAPFVAIVILAPFKYGALANAVTTPTTSHVDIIGGLLIAMWNYMGWDNSSTIAAEVKQPQRTYPRGTMGAGGCRHAHQAEPHSVGDRLVGRHCRTAGRSALARGAGTGGHDERLWHVQRVGDGLFAPATGHG